MRILFVCHRFPYPPHFGASVRSFNMIKHLAQRHEVVVCSLVRSDKEAEEGQGMRPYCAEFHMAQVNNAVQTARMIATLPTPLSASSQYFHSGELAATIKRLLREQRFDLIIAYSSSVAHYVEHVRDIPKIMDFVDMDSQKWLSYVKDKPFPLNLGYWWEGKRVLADEKRIARCFDLCTVATRAELDSLNGFGIQVDTDWFPNGVDTTYFAPTEEPYDTDLLSFIGRMDYYPNQQCMFDFCAQVLPLLKQRRPSVKLTIVGAEPSPQVRALGEIAGVTVTGSVPDVRPYVRKSALTVAPLKIARGMQNKVLESMAMGVPVVASDMVARGVDVEPGVHLLSAESPSEFCEAILRVLNNPAERRRLADAGRVRVLSHMTWPSTMQRFDDMIARYVSARSAASAMPQAASQV